MDNSSPRKNQCGCTGEPPSAAPLHGNSDENIRTSEVGVGVHAANCITPEARGSETTSAADSSGSFSASAENADIGSLLEAVRAGDGAAFIELSAKYRPMTESAAKKFSRRQGRVSGEDEEDCLQEAVIALFLAAQTYRAENTGVSFGAYARACVYNRLCDLVRKHSRRLSSAVVLSEAEQDLSEIPASEGESDPEAAAIAAEQTMSIKAKIDAALTDYERSVFRLYLLGLSYREMAARLNVGEKSIDNAVGRIKRKCRDIFGIG